MKKIMKSVSVLLLLLVVFSFAACGEDTDTSTGDNSASSSSTSSSSTSSGEGVQATGLWADAMYVKDTTLGEGANTVTVTVEAEGQSIVLTVKTDKDNLGAALYELELIDDPSFFSVCNGMTADWNKDQAYWAFYVGDDYATYGVDSATTAGSPVYKIVYTK